MLLLRKIYLFSFLTIVLTMAGCGFTPVYKEDGSGLTEKLVATKVEPIAAYGRTGQILQTSLENLLNPKSINPDKTEYKLSITSLKKNITIQTIEQNREITRYNMTVTVKYELKDGADNKIVSKGKSRMVDSYDAVQSDFATFTAENDTLQRIIKEIARDIRFKLVDHLVRR